MWVPKTEEKTYFCHKCSGKLEFEVKMMRTDVCPHCAADMHVCKNCEYWDPGEHNQCREKIAEYVADRERTNYCSYFTFKSGERTKLDKAAVRQKLDALFKK
ncbi:MAG: hypothetical protein HY905_18900 [Deltaproteobacteria bacterium]|nr:hypothetical protein [Deltaproteobacteria bacterium]